jgi:hypothetical protein
VRYRKTPGNLLQQATAQDHRENNGLEAKHATHRNAVQRHSSGTVFRLCAWKTLKKIAVLKPAHTHAHTSIGPSSSAQRA